MSLFLDMSFSDIILLINNKKINEKDILTAFQKFFDLYNDKYNILNNTNTNNTRNNKQC